MSIYRKWLLIILLFFIYILFSASSYASSVSTHLSNSVFRLHILANSNSQEDQALKYLVRDRLTNTLQSLSKDCKTKEDVIQVASQNATLLQQEAQNVIIENGFSYPVTIAINAFAFPTKNYGDISLPAGVYDALRVEIGKGEGQNWWCVMFPPLCFVDISTGIVPEESKKLIRSHLSEEEFSIVSENSVEESPNISFKFKLLEWFGSVSNFLTASK